jgi:tetratricopeptide (TPR) repeat protein
MIRKLSRLISILLILAAALYIVLLNSSSVSVNLGGGKIISTPLGVLIIVIFALGVLSTAVVASFFGFKAYLKEQGFLREENRRVEFSHNAAKARGLTLSSNFYEAKRLWEQLIKQNPNDPEAKVWLAKTLRADGDIKEAIKVLDKARNLHPQDIEVLFLASELNEELGNMTSAIDNLALIIAHHPNQSAALKARELSLKLGRFDDALEYNKELADYDSIEAESIREFESKIKLAKIKRQFSDSSKSDPQEFLKELAKLSREYPESSASYQSIAEIELNSNNLDKASQALVKAAYIQQTPEAWFKAIDLWIKQKQPERALSVARLALKDSSDTMRQEFELLLAKTQVLLGMYNEASQILQKIKEKSGDSEHLSEVVTLLGFSLAKDGKQHEAANLWLQLGASPRSLS